MGNDARPFAVYPESNSGSDTRPMRFDPSQWDKVGTKNFGEQPDTIDGFYHYNTEETLYRGGESWLILSRKTHFDIGELGDPVYRVLTIDEAAEWFVDCEDTPPTELNQLLKSRMISPETCGTIIKTAIRNVTSEFTARSFIEYWYKFESIWDQLDLLCTKRGMAEPPDVEIENLVVQLVTLSQSYSELSYPDRWFYTEAIARHFPDQQPCKPPVVSHHDLYPPFGEINQEYRKMANAVQETTVVLTKYSPLPRKSIGEALSGVSFFGTLCSGQCIELIKRSDDRELRDELFRRALQSLQNDDQHELSTSKPKWDGRKLMIDDVVITQYRRPSKNQTAILKAFEDNEWSSRVTDPLPPPADAQRLRETVADLNERQQTIQFRCDGTGAGVTWEMRG
jgi:hypothetical protein